MYSLYRNQSIVLQIKFIIWEIYYIYYMGEHWRVNGTKHDKAAIEMFMMQLIFTLDKSSFLLSRYFWIYGFTKTCSYYDICKPKLSAAPLKLKIPHIMLFVFLARHFTFVQLKKGKEETRKFVNEASGRCILWDFR